MGNSNYQVEIDQFTANFGKYKDKKIVLYGIGRRTATLVADLEDFNIVGLMDKDTDNIGKMMYGLPILNLSDAEQKADMIVINAPETYWETIYKRIQKSKCPIFYLSGERAYIKNCNSNYRQNPYWKKTEKELYNVIENYQIVSFDIFDTLIMRRTVEPLDVWTIIDSKIKENGITDIEFGEIRRRAASELDIKDPNFDEIYDKFMEITDLSYSIVNQIKEIELQTEEQVIVPRCSIVKACNKAIRDGKQVSFVSDMYLPSSFIRKILIQSGVEMKEDSLILISGEEKARKSDGKLWDIYCKRVVKGRKALHIGDNPKGDIEEAKKFGIDTFYIMNGMDMLKNSSIGDIYHNICTQYSSHVMGNIISQIFNNPFECSKNRGLVVFDDEKMLGYSLFGPVIYTFLQWINKQVEQRNIKEIVFCARDGYFLYDDFIHLQGKLCKTDIISKYIYASRRAFLIPSIVTEDDYVEAVRFPYNGTFGEYIKDRFDIMADSRTADVNNEFINSTNDYKKIIPWLNHYKKEIDGEILTERKNYLNYYNGINISEDFVLVDLFYYGNQQYLMSKLLGKSLKGLYFAANLSEDNHCLENNELIPCFQEDDDKKAERSMVFKMGMLIESFLTAPYGMIKKVDNDGKMICSEEKTNQKYFDERVKINEGIKLFMDDMVTLGTTNIDTRFTDALYGLMMGGGCELSDNLKKIFSNDNAMIQRRETSVFE